VSVTPPKEGIVNLFKEVALENVPEPKEVKEFGNIAEVKEVELATKFVPILFKVFGNSKLFKAVKLENTLLPIVFNAGATVSTFVILAIN
jgi:hypothetical protein